MVAIYGALAIALTWISTRQARAFLDAAVEAGQENARFIGNVLNGMDTLRHFGSQSWMNKRFMVREQEVRDNWRAYVLRRLPYIAVLGFAVALQFAVTLLLIPEYYGRRGHHRGYGTVQYALLQLNMPFKDACEGDLRRGAVASSPYPSR
ncbi:hypothetical protein ACNJYA_10885 [Bradyrhizobium sp. DASA03068]|uniref:hypothetical protein n=1 Tax=Bradyrhizobium sp. BLXBL-01 TaxID=3395915 RepID=UPI003F7139D4